MQTVIPALGKKRYFGDLAGDRRDPVLDDANVLRALHYWSRCGEDADGIVILEGREIHPPDCTREHSECGTALFARAELSDCGIRDSSQACGRPAPPGFRDERLGRVCVTSAIACLLSLPRLFR